MPTGIIGRKVGMTRIFDANGRVVPCTVIEAGPCVVVQRRTSETDGYEAVQLGFGERKPKHTNMPLEGHFRSKDLAPRKHLKEFRIDAGDAYGQGDLVTVEMFVVGSLVNVTGQTKGKGFAGGMKRHGFHGGPASHGSKVHRAPMSAGATDAARTFPGQKMPGRLGNVRRKIKNLQVIDVDANNNVLVLKGSIPGAPGSIVEVELS